MPKDPQLIKASLRVLNGKAQLYPNDITVIHQALIDISDNLIDLMAKLAGVIGTDQTPNP
jgi:hypothetical protein